MNGIIWLIMLFLACSEQEKREQTVKPRLSCGEELVAIPPNAPIFCLMPYEAHVPKGKEVALSKQGIKPTANTSLLEAMEYCENSSLLDQNGFTRNKMKLVTWKHWRDAADGIIGDGGTLYPWGNTNDGRCILDDPRNPKRWKSYQVSGFAKECKSKFGVYDQVGNLWEWVDMEQTADLDRFLEKRKNEGYIVSIDSTTGEIRIRNRLLGQIQVNTICMRVGSIFLKRGILYGRLQKELGSDCAHRGKGYLIVGDAANSSQGDILPIYLEDQGNGIAKVLLDVTRLGEQVGAKVGGSFYSGGETNIYSVWIGHVPSFDGSIGFRCEATPYEE